MFPFKQTFPSPDEKTAGKNTKEYIVVHHTGSKEWTIKWVLDWLYRRKDYASCHFVIDVNGDAYKIGSPDDILWHCWVSKWADRNNMNAFSLGIEVIGPCSDGGFTNEQVATLKLLIGHLRAVFNIPIANVLRHKDIAPWRKIDPADTLWNKKWKTWDEFRTSITAKMI